MFEHPPTRVRIGKAKLPTRYHLTVEEELPDNFVYTPDQLTPERDQGKCGSCWAFAITSSIADTIKIKYGNDTPLSVQNLLTCLQSDNVADCQGAAIDEALQDLSNDTKALVPETLAPYLQLTDGNLSGSCFTDSSPYGVNIEGHTSYKIRGKNRSDTIRNMKAHIYHDGPIIGTMLAVYPDFFKYDGKSVYIPAAGQKSVGGHAIEILGWGKTAPTDGTPSVDYWICRNSWGLAWPAQHLPGTGGGWFYIQMGANASRIEEEAFKCIPTPTTDYSSTTDTDALGDVSFGQINPSAKPPIIVPHHEDSMKPLKTLLLLIVLAYVGYVLYKKFEKERK